MIKGNLSPTNTRDYRVLIKSVSSTRPSVAAAAGQRPTGVDRRNPSSKPRIYATPVDTGYANRYGYQANISDKLTFKIVPAPDGADELRVLPDLRGKTIAESRVLMELLGLEPRVRDGDGVLLEDPDAGAKVITQEPLPEQQRFARLGEEIILIID